MKDHSGCIRAFYRLSHAYYKSKVFEDTDYIMIGMYDSEDFSTTGEFCMEWHNLTDGLPSPRIRAFDDAWSALWNFRDLLEKMAEIDGNNIQEPDFCKLMESLGIIDITEYEQGKRGK